MRTTLTLDPDVERLLADAVHRERRPFKQVVNDAIRRGLSPPGHRASAARYRVRPHHTALMPGIDPEGLNRLLDRLEDDAILARAAETTVSRARPKTRRSTKAKSPRPRTKAKATTTR